MFLKMSVRLSCLVLRVFSLSNWMIFFSHKNLAYLLYSRVYRLFDRTAYYHRYNSSTGWCRTWDSRGEFRTVEEERKTRYDLVGLSWYKIEIHVVYGKGVIGYYEPCMTSVLCVEIKTHLSAELTHSYLSLSINP